ncbi:MAG: AraC family transcriptional regulator [bacterium]
MTVKELIEKTGWKLDTPTLDLSMEIEGAYCGDLLSWVMGNGLPGQAWITVQVHSNVIAVALLREFSCIIIAENANATDAFIQRMVDEEVVLIESGLPEYETAKTLAQLGV